jgi:hypothetical protein
MLFKFVIIKNHVDIILLLMYKILSLILALDVSIQLSINT